MWVSMANNSGACIGYRYVQLYTYMYEASESLSTAL